jgi:flagellar hook-basal body complex protein FliE
MLFSVNGRLSIGPAHVPFFRRGETMTVPVNALTSALQQMQAMAAEAAGGSQASALGEQAGAANAGSFAAALKSSLDKINSDQQKSDGEWKAFEVGASNVSLNDVMVDMQKAGIGFQFGLQVRNRLVTAYNEIMQMSI